MIELSKNHATHNTFYATYVLALYSTYCFNSNVFIMVVVSLSLRLGHLPVVRYLVENQHCDVSVTDDYGRVPLHLSCE